jgi:hypothetical protein
MYNCVKVMQNGRCVAIFPDIDKADMYIQLMKQQFGHLDIQWNSDWAYIDGLVF